MITQEQAEAELAPYMATLRKCIQSGWENWVEFGRVAPALKAPVSTRGRANLISDWVCNTVRHEFARLRGVRIIEARGFPELIIKERYVIRFKKLDRKGRSRNILTKQQRDWFNGQLSFPGMSPEDVSRLVAGYILDLLGTEMERVLVTCPIGASGVAWSINLDSPSASNVIELHRSVKAPKPPAVRSKKRKLNDARDE